MNHDQTKDWRAIAHEEFENRKSLEFEVDQIRSKFADSEEALAATNNYNAILAKKLVELESKNAQLTAKLQHGIKLLKQAKILFTKYQQQIQTLKDENQALKEEVIKKSAMLDAEVAQHEKTNQKLANALSKLATSTSMELTGAQYLPSPPNRPGHATAPDVLYAESMAERCEDEFTPAMFDEANPRGSVLHHVALEPQKPEEATQNHDSPRDFIDQVFAYEKEFNK